MEGGENESVFDGLNGKVKPTQETVGNILTDVPLKTKEGYVSNLPGSVADHKHAVYTYD